MGGRVSWGEAIRLTQVLAGDPSSQVGAALGDLDYPVSREAIVLMDLFDLQHASKSKHRPKPYPRPWPDVTKTRFGDASLPVDVLERVLAEHRAAVDREEAAARG